MGLKGMCWLFDEGYSEEDVVYCPYCEQEVDLQELDSSFDEWKALEKEIKCPDCKRTMKVSVDRPVKIQVFKEHQIKQEGDNGEAVHNSSDTKEEVQA